MSKNFRERRPSLRNKIQESRSFPPPSASARQLIDPECEKAAQELRQHMQSENYTPSTIEKIAKDLSAAGEQWLLLRRAASMLERLDEVVIDQSGHLTPRAPLTVCGRLSVHPKGFAFLQSDDELDIPHWRGELFISKSNRLGAIQGDVVRAQVYTHNISPKGPEGRILTVLHRQHQTAIATLAEELPNRCFAANSSLFPGKMISVNAPQKIRAAVGDRVLFRLAVENQDAPQSGNGALEQASAGTIEKNLGSIDNAALDIPIAVIEFGLKDRHSKGAIDEARAFGNEVLAQDKVGRADLRSWEIFTIDPETAKDFDDALSLQVVGNRYQLGVHIADVAHFVAAGSKLDQEAVERSNSTYFPGICLPMLPHELSDHLCSLKPQVERLTVSVLMQFDESGELLHHVIERSIIKSQSRYSYQQAREMIEGRATGPHLQTVLKMVELCKILKERRKERGSIDLAVPEWVVKCDEGGSPTDMELHEYDFSHQLVEEFMLKANEVVAKSLSDRQLPLIYRVHESPADEVMDSFATFAAAFGCELKSPIDSHQLQKLFSDVKDEFFAPQLFVSYIRSLKQAMYDVQNVGHYGLCLEHYCHFTSPIRRYADLTVMRTLFAKDNQIAGCNLSSIAQNCSERERISARAEMSVLTLKKMRLLKAKLLAGQSAFKALITKVRPFGIYFELHALMLEGFLHVSNLGNEYFQFDVKEQVLRGKSGSEFASGAAICPHLKSVDLISMQTHWSLAEST